MRLDSGSLLYSPTDLVNFLGCAHSTVLDISQLGVVADIPPATDEYLELLQLKGIEHEQAYLEQLRATGLSIAEIPQRLSSLNERVELTRRAMARGDDIIYQGALFAPPWHGYSDFLIKVHGTPSKLGNHSYEVADTKLARSAKPKHVIQLCVYSNLVGNEQGFLPKATHVVLGNKSKVSLDVQDFIHYCTVAVRQFESFLSSDERATSAEPCGHCDFCRWAEQCKREWDAADHLSIVANISRAQIAKLREHGVGNMRSLAELEAERTIARMQAATLERLRSQARLQVAKRAGGLDAYELLQLEPERGFARLPKPSDGDLFFDIEGDPLFEDGGLDYLFGFDHVDGEETKFTAFWAHTRAGEKKAFQRLMDFITQRLAEYPDAHVYHYAGYEESALKRLAMIHGTREVEVDELLRGRKLVDLYKVIREGIRVSEPSYSLKNLETFYFAGRRGGEVKSGGDSVVAYENWRELDDPRLLEDIRAYNEIDCKSTRACRDWLLSLRPADVAWLTPPIDADAEKEAARADERREAEAASAVLQERLLDGVDASASEWLELLGHLLDFHKREAKHEWWEMFKRQEMTVEQLIDDRACLGGLVPDTEVSPVADKKSFVYTFRFPDQDSRIRVGDRVMRAGVPKGTDLVVALDEDERRISIKAGPSRPTIAYPLSLTPSGPMNDQVLRDAIRRYAELVADGQEDDFPAVTDLLRNVPGRDSSYSLIQGPPGAGKTYESSRRIVDLLAQGKRVGVSSMTHKAINNLLSAVEKRAREQGVVFRGIKKSSTEDQYLNGSGLVEDTTDNDTAASGDYQLVAGTAFLFARPDFDATLDYLYIDEAGQVCLANVVAMGMCARRIVLVGDQMQLSQPLQGAHPGRSGLSVLKHLLGDLAIVPADRGVFLSETRRLHPDICRFISDAVYDGKLAAASGNERQRLVLRSGALLSSGIQFVDVAHEGNSQESEEEAARIAETYATLLGEHWVDRDDKPHVLTHGDILVVSPYNMQVNLLRQMLPKGARVGTVDKFQGQEAAVVLISMATSSGEDLPRDIAFLFSRNRLNVAISRARCLAVIFASPRLLEVACGTIEQMRLVNTLCWAKTYAESLRHPSPPRPPRTDSDPVFRSLS